MHYNILMIPPLLQLIGSQNNSSPPPPMKRLKTMPIPLSDPPKFRFTRSLLLDSIMHIISKRKFCRCDFRTTLELELQ